jgi:hypothetical protein
MVTPKRQEAQRLLEETLQAALRERPEIALRAPDIMRGVRAQFDQLLGTLVSDPPVTSKALSSLLTWYHTRAQDKSWVSQKPLNQLIEDALRTTIKKHQWMTPEELAELDAAFAITEGQRAAVQARQAEEMSKAFSKQAEPTTPDQKPKAEKKAATVNRGQARPPGSGVTSWEKRVKESSDTTTRRTTRPSRPPLEVAPPPHPHLIVSATSSAAPFQSSTVFVEPTQPSFSLDKLQVELAKNPDSETLKKLYMSTWFHIETLSIYMGMKGILNTITDQKIPDIELPKDAFFARMEGIKKEARAFGVLANEKKKETETGIEVEVPDRYQLAVAHCLEAINDLYTLYACAPKKEAGRER